MKLLQQDDIQEWLNEPKKQFRWIYLLTKIIVKAENKKKAIQNFKKYHKISPLKTEVRQARMTE